MKIKGLLRADISECFGVDERTVDRWIKEGLPRNPDGKFYLPDCIKWRVGKAALKKKKGSGAKDDPEKEIWLAALRKEQARSARLKRLETENELVRFDTAIQILSEEITAAKNGFLGMGRKLSPRLVGLETRAIEIELNGEVEQILTKLSKREKNEKRRR